AALVTPDRALARRVAGELQRFGIEADDSGGAPFSTTLPGGLARLIVAAAFGPVDPAGLLTLLKHPLVRLSLDRAEMRARAELFERVAMRGGVGRPDPLALTDFFETRLSLSSLSNRPPEWSGHVNEEKLAELRAMAAAFDAAMSPLGALRDGRHRLPVFAQALVQAAEALARGPAGDAVPLYDGPAGEAFLSLMRGLIESGERLDCTAAEFPSVLDALVDPVSVKPDPGGHPRVSIWGALEARLQTVDFLVLGGLNEGSWPSVSGDDPFLSRPMKTMMRLAPPERRIGQAAHDFQMAMGAPAVLLTRSARSEGAPTVASRWWQRLVTVAGEDAVQRMRAAGDEKLAWARALDRRSDVPFAPRPEPRPPLAARPKRFSVTEIETLRRDAYAIYARKVLALQPLDPFVRDPDAAERGQLFHDILETFVHEKVDPLADDAQEQLLAIGARHFEAEELPPEVHAVWWPRFAAMAPNIIAWERERAADIAARVVEIGARATEIGDTGVTLSGRADRIDRLKDGSAAILDYKTGTYPSPKQAHILVAPQLPLEGALLQRGAFHGFAPTTPGDLAYVRLKPKGDVQHDSILKIQGSAKTAAELSQQAWEKLEDLVASYNDPAQGYLSRAMPFRQGDIEGDYDHLARVLEWSAGNGEAEEPS
ncbi:MAG TPA: double-strand break repair protein AddB, partial [Rhizobiaceae bacterium]|nr:double-strand break repair protein AddB [Rhizobiaceae bacterium]